MTPIERLAALTEQLATGADAETKRFVFDADGRPVGVTAFRIRFDPRALISEGSGLARRVLPRSATAAEMAAALTTRAAFYAHVQRYLRPSVRGTWATAEAGDLAALAELSGIDGETAVSVGPDDEQSHDGVGVPLGPEADSLTLVGLRKRSGGVRSSGIGDPR